MMPQHWPAQADLLQWCQTMGPLTAVLLMGIGVVYILFGWYLYKSLVTLNAAVIGALVGAIIGDKLGSMGAGVVLGAFIAGVVTWPTMKYAVSVMGGLFGAVLGASLWRAANLEPSYAASGAAMGLILFGLLSFIIFRGSVILYTSLQGAVMFIIGLLGLVYKYQDLAPKITESMTVKPFLLPMIIFIATIIGQVYQQTRYPRVEPKP